MSNFIGVGSYFTTISTGKSKGIKIEGNLYENERLGMSVIVLSNPEVEKFNFTIIMMPAVKGGRKAG